LNVYDRDMRIAIFSDVLSNLPSLDAVLADIDTADVDARYVLGDLVGYASWPNEVLERLRAEQVPIVMGNYDDGTGFDRGECGCAYTNPVEKALGDEGFAWTKAHTGEIIPVVAISSPTVGTLQRPAHMAWNA
jgi:hypothetical protein